MATNTLPATGSNRPASARRTTVFMKMLMAVSGALFVFYVLAHMYGNLKIFAGVRGLRRVRRRTCARCSRRSCPSAGSSGSSASCSSLALVAHAWSAFYLWSRARGARTTRYVAKRGGAGHRQEQDDALGRRRPAALPRLAPAAVHDRQVQRRLRGGRRQRRPARHQQLPGVVGRADLPARARRPRPAPLPRRLERHPDAGLGRQHRRAPARQDHRHRHRARDERRLRPARRSPSCSESSRGADL